ncbi:pyridoxamine 5'-phosphate oxidase family protein [Rhizobium sp. G21]|uniref:pyridoxamine 5'-phosphate oxidase family protein n=1 Tax=Rhizobium sp. G21 TaxID=2758439 RepID=UPI0016032096|nr:pyridoxamine 5'-phosphate oxidase family protein [Rhizobium sp. G21]MBB1250392.1 pyridoxamine 5'-phosphate oxidase family protein [Rhizobium sp. G21]
MQEETPLIRPTDEEARKLARTLLRGARYGALAVLDPETGFPLATRTLVGADLDGAPVLLISRLAAHTRALAADPRCSLLVGEPRKGDPLAWPRLTVTGEARGWRRAPKTKM